MSDSNRSISRRDVLAMAALYGTSLPILGCSEGTKINIQAKVDSDPKNDLETGTEPRKSTDEPEADRDTSKDSTMKIHYLEIVTEQAEKACELYAAIYGATFGEAVAALGNARTAKLSDGGMIGVRAPMHGGESAVTRAYVLVDDINSSVEAAKSAGAEIAVPPMEIAGYGTCAILIHGGIESGLWQV